MYRGRNCPVTINRTVKIYIVSCNFIIRNMLYAAEKLLSLSMAVAIIVSIMIRMNEGNVVKKLTWLRR